MAKDVKLGTRPLTRTRARRWALLWTLRTLRRSVVNGRPISLPNLLRFYRRRGSEVMPMLIGGPPDSEWLREFYLTEQPFHDTDWRRWCAAVRSTARKV
ncbi:MAG: hypothetical protein ABSH20_28430 [Tepidisphaeraceae bacterium]